MREQALIGKLYNASQQKADSLGMDEPDVEALADAYVQAIDHGIHGGFPERSGRFHGHCGSN